MCLGFNRGLTKLARNHDQIEEDVGQFRFDSKKFEDGSISSSRINRWVDFHVTPLVPFGTIRNPSICSVNIPSASLSYAAILPSPATYWSNTIRPSILTFLYIPWFRAFSLALIDARFTRQSDSYVVFRSTQIHSTLQLIFVVFLWRVFRLLSNASFP